MSERCVAGGNAVKGAVAVFREGSMAEQPACDFLTAPPPLDFKAGKLADFKRFLLNLFTPPPHHHHNHLHSSFTRATMTEPHPLQQWFTSVGVQLHPSLYLAQDPETGLSFYSSEPLPKDTTVIKVPSELCITSHSAFVRIQRLFKGEYEDWEEKMKEEDLPKADWILFYLVLSRVAIDYLSTYPDAEDRAKVTDCLAHLPYVAHIPSVIETPLHYSSAELNLLCQTPLFSSTERRLKATIFDWTAPYSMIPSQPRKGGFLDFFNKMKQPITLQDVQSDAFMSRTYHKALELWRWAESAFTSRSFPARLVGLDDTTTSPILILAYDTFNHARAHPVTWTHLPATATEGSMVAMTLNYETEGGCQVWNNYGGKSNEEFLSSYGFVLDTNSEDTLALKLGSIEPGVEGKTHYWMFPRSTNDEVAQGEGGAFKRAKCPCPSLLEELELRVLQGDEPPTGEQQRLELYGEILETLESLLLSKRKSFKGSQKRIESKNIIFVENRAEPNPKREGWHRAKWTGGQGIRKSVLRNVMQYRKGQMELLNHAVDWTRGELGRVADALDEFDDQ